MYLMNANYSLPPNTEHVNGTDTIQEFFLNLYSDTTGYLSITTIKKGVVKTKQFSTNELERAVLYANEQAENGVDVYFSLGLQHELLDSNSRGKAENVCAIPGLWADIDIADEKAHSSRELPPNSELALKIIACLPFKPTIIIFSGHGLHIYFLFTEPWILSNEAERREAEMLSRGLQSVLREEAKKSGWILDNTANLAQMLRVPNSFNYKNPEDPKTVSILEANYERRYSPQDFKQFLNQYLQPDDDSDTTTKRGSVDDILNNCVFIQHCRDNSRALTEPEWHAMVNICCHTVDGVKKIHEFSCDYPKYSEEETDEKIRQALQKNCPHSCRYIKEELGFDCPEDGCGPGVVSPLSHATNSTVIALRMIKEQQQTLIETPHAVFDDNTLASLAQLKRGLPKEYASFREKMRGRINLLEMDKHVKTKVNEIKRENSLEKDYILAEFDDIFSDIPLKKLKVPPDYIVKKEGLFCINTNGDDYICVSLTPVVIIRYISNLDTGTQKVELAVNGQGKWNSIIVSRNTVATRNGIVSLPDRGLQVTSETAKYLVDYFHKLEMVNHQTIPTSRAVNHFGWSQNNFIPGYPGELILDLEDNTYQIAKGVRETGSLESWKQNLSPLREHPIARFIISTAFASPLLTPLKQRVFVLHTWCRSKGGKTAATYAALSVWGDPDILRASFKDTAVAIERKAALFSNLPMVLDEKQVVEAYKYDQIEAIIYQLTQGSSKGRGNKDGGFQQFNTWANICISSGEEPITTNSSKAGVVNRLLEIYGEPIPDEEEARKVYSWTTEQHGTAGVAFIKKLIEYMEEQPDFLNNQFSLALNMLEEEYPEGNLQYLVNIAIVMLGDYLSSVWVFGEDDSTAWESAKELGLNIAQKVCEEHVADEAMQAYEHILTWYASNSEHFSTKEPYYGFIEDVLGEEIRYINIYPQIFDKAMREEGFNSRRIKQDWAEKELLLFEEGTERTKRRLSRRLRDPYVRATNTFISIKTKRELTPGEEFDIAIGNNEDEGLNVTDYF